MPRGYVELQQQFFPIKYTDVPFDVPNIEVHLYWHQRHDSDTANKWLRRQLVVALSKVASIKVNKTAMELVNLTREI